jgi:hypothetical protein
MKIQRHQDIALPEAFYQMLEQRLQSALHEHANIVTLNFRDPDYDPENGGYHPVEIGLMRYGDTWELSYMTDFAYFGSYYPELEKDIDVLFQEREVYTSYAGRSYLREVSELVQSLVENFVSYLSLGVYVEQVSAD